MELARSILISIFAVLFLTGVACESVDETNATATAVGGGIDRDFLSAEATAAAEEGDFDDRLLIVDATATAEAGGHDDRLQLVYADATAETIEFSATATAESIIWDATSTAIAIEEEEEDETSTREVQTSRRGGNSGTGGTGTPSTSDATPIAIVPTASAVPEASATPEPTQTPVPVPTATELPVVMGPWLTALEAVDAVLATHSGKVKSIVAHVSHEAGQTDVGDSTNTTASPGAGYASSWEVAIIDGDDHYYCDVRTAVADCSTSSAGAPYIVDLSVDSTEMFAVWADNSDWKELLRNDNISVLAYLRSDGEDAPTIWQASITVHGETDGLRGGNFNWTPSTGDTDFSKYK